MAQSTQRLQWHNSLLTALHPTHWLTELSSVFPLWPTDVFCFLAWTISQWSHYLFLLININDTVFIMVLFFALEMWTLKRNAIFPGIRNVWFLISNIMRPNLFGQLDLFYEWIRSICSSGNVYVKVSYPDNSHSLWTLSCSLFLGAWNQGLLLCFCLFVYFRRKWFLFEI